MTTATLTKVGNSAAAFIPSSLREQAGIAVGDTYSIESPHEGVVVLRFRRSDGNERLARFERAQRSIQAAASSIPAWDDSLTADDLIRAGKDGRTHDVVLH